VRSKEGANRMEGVGGGRGGFGRLILCEYQKVGVGEFFSCKKTHKQICMTKNKFALKTNYRCY
jgi:hypothetical protein